MGLLIPCPQGPVGSNPIPRAFLLGVKTETVYLTFLDWSETNFRKFEKTERFRLTFFV
ncbi:hypothetical protein NITUZ_40238 [Candidatus Nitrosotenuis uzonensis]|uniref:Uncharacterized protein n=1 Tax=Candidatus Nitrosotenuis uzonensis TaxID=1407055 RepID=V6ATU9_9ARCH|nr:hypothetical protein NITUZ_40238 [Candidatus Nitrosotenuis uzonensis]